MRWSGERRLRLRVLAAQLASPFLCRSSHLPCEAGLIRECESVCDRAAVQRRVQAAAVHRRQQLLTAR